MGVPLRFAPGRAARAVGNDTTVANGAEPLRSRARYCCALLLRFSALRARITHANGVTSPAQAPGANSEPLRSRRSNYSIYNGLRGHLAQIVRNLRMIPSVRDYSLFPIPYSLEVLLATR